MSATPAAWARQRAWRELDRHFGEDGGRQFIHTWLAWQSDPQRPRMLHYVALCGPKAPDLQTLRAAGAPPELADTLASQWFGLLPGFHRLVLEEGRLMLTLCVGEPEAALKELVLEPDAPSPPLADPVTQALSGAPPHHCIVIGAGLAGASVAAALARRGVVVDVLDAAPHPAAGASGLPAGLMAPLLAADDGPRARLSRAGLRLGLQQARSLLRAGEDWGATGVLERGLKGKARLPGTWPAEGRAWSEPASLEGPQPPGLARLLAPPALWHRAGAWVKPAALVRAWLASEGVRFTGNAAVARLQAYDGGWAVLGGDGQVLAQGSQVVLANAWGAKALAGTLLPANPALAAVHGQVSWACHGEKTEPWPPCPVNGLGSFIPHIPQGTTQAWYAGATFEREALTVEEAHRANLARLERLLPEGAGLLRDAITDDTLQAWRATRCTSADRLPMVGRLTHPQQAGSLWVSTAMGARGLSLGVLCAELLAAQMCHEPLPVEASLARLLDARRGAPPRATA